MSAETGWKPVFRPVRRLPRKREQTSSPRRERKIPRTRSDRLSRRRRYSGHWRNLLWLAKSTPTTNFSSGSTMLCANSIPTGLSPMGIVPHATRTSYASQNCSALFRRTSGNRPPDLTEAMLQNIHYSRQEKSLPASLPLSISIIYMSTGSKAAKTESNCRISGLFPVSSSK